MLLTAQCKQHKTKSKPVCVKFTNKNGLRLNYVKWKENKNPWESDATNKNRFDLRQTFKSDVIPENINIIMRLVATQCGGYFN